MSQGRPKLPPRVQIIFRLDQNLAAEMYALKPELRDHIGGTKYGALNSYLTSLVVQDLQRIKDAVREQAKKKANG